MTVMAVMCNAKSSFKLTMGLSGADPECNRPFTLSIRVQSIYGFLHKESLSVNRPLALTSLY